ncbi:MAG: polysaccharide biosynthesis tyrosine autokinase, partial [Betaproteobacteria bacterium]
MSAQENALPIEVSGRVIGQGDRRIGSLLAAEGKLDGGDIDRIMAVQGTEGLRFGDAALRLGLISADDLHHVIAKQYDIPSLLPGQGSTSSELVVAREPFHPRAEELRALRTQLLIRWSKAKVESRVLAIVSPGADEGRSYVAANLAVAFSQLGERTLLIDADLRSPRQHLIFNVPDRVGLAAVLDGRAGRSAVTPVPEFGPLCILPAGAHPPNPQELLSRLALGVLLHELKGEFDVILLDTPPAKVYADAQAVAFRAGNAIVLARKDRTRLEDARSVI